MLHSHTVYPKPFITVLSLTIVNPPVLTRLRRNHEQKTYHLTVLTYEPR